MSEHLILATSEPPAPMEQTILRIRADAIRLKETMTAAHVRSAFLILERARDDLSEVLERGRFDR